MLEEAGWFVVRSAGSKGPFDLIAIGGILCRCIQVKKGVPTKADEDGLREMAETLPKFCTVELWQRHGPKDFHIRRLRPTQASAIKPPATQGGTPTPNTPVLP